MRTIFGFLLRQRVFFNIVFFGLILFGVFYSAPKIPIDRYPNINFGEVVVSTSYPGASAEEVERLVTEEIEETLRGMENIEFIRSSSMAGYSSINVKFVDDTNYDFLYDQLRLRVLGSQNLLPVINGKPLTPTFNVTRVDDWLPVIQVNLLSASADRPMTKRSMARLAKELQMELEQIDGVQEARLNGEEVQQYTITLSPELMKGSGLSLLDVQRALSLSGGSQPAGVINTDQGERNIVVDDRFRNREDLLATVIRRDGNDSLLTLQDIVDLKNSGLEKMQGGVITSVDGLDTMSLQIVKNDWANSKDIKESVLQVVELFEGKHAALPIAINTTLDSTSKIDDGLGVLQGSLNLALILVMLAIFLFLSPHRGKVVLWVSGLAIASLIFMIRFHDQPRWQLIALAINVVVIFITCRAAVLTVTGIVFSFLGCLIAFQILGYSLNEITLLGFVLTTGIIVDDAIVVLENIQRHREKGKGLMDSAIDGTAEVFLPVFSASLTTIAAFLPMLIMTGSTGEFFSLIPIAVSTALVISLFECLFIMPIHVVELERLGRRKNAEHTPPPQSTGIVQSMTKLYDKSLSWCLRHPWLSLASVFGLFFLAVSVLIQSAMGPSMGMKPLLKLEFFPDDTSNIQIIIRMPSNSTLQQSDSLSREVSAALLDLGPDKIKSATANAGLAIDAAYKPVFGSHLSFLMVELPRKVDRSFDNPVAFIEDIKKMLEERFEKDGVKLEVSAQKDGPPTGAPVHIRISGVSEDSVIRLGQDLYEEITLGQESGSNFHGMTDLQSDRSNFTTTMRFKTARDRAAQLGLTPYDVRFFTAALFDGAYVGDLRMEDEDVPIRVRLKQADRINAEELLTFPLMEIDGRSIYYEDVGSWSINDEPSSLERRDFQRIINITAQVDPQSILQPGDFMKRIREWYTENASDYPGATLAFGGEAESTARSYRSLAMAFGLAIFLIYGILSVQFQSYSQPFLIMANIFFSFTGVILMTGLLGGLNLLLPEGVIAAERAMVTVQSFIAIIGLTGLVVNDAIVLIDFINAERRKGTPLLEAVKTGAHHRVRPIIMTTWSTIAGLLPLAIGIPDFSITWGPFATCFVAGLTMSTLMTLLIIPVLYHLLEKFKEKFSTAQFQPSKFSTATFILVVIVVLSPVSELKSEELMKKVPIPLMASVVGEPEPIVLKSIDDAVSMAHENHPDISAARSMLMASESREKQTFWSFGPTLTFSGQMGPQNDQITPSNPGGSNRFHQIQGQIDQFLFGFGQRLYQNRASRFETEVSQLERERTKAELTLRVSQAYATAIFHHMATEVYERQVALATTEYEIVNSLKDAGASSVLDLRRAEITLSHAKNEKEKSVTEHKNSLLNISILINQKVRELVGDLGVSTIKKTSSNILIDNLHLKSLETQTQRQLALEKSSKSMTRPTLSAFASGSRYGNEWDDVTRDWKAGVSLSWSPDASRSKHHQSLYHKETANQISFQKESLKLEIIRNLSAIENENSGLETMLSTQNEIVHHAKSNHKTLVELYEAGSTLYLRVQEALLEATLAELELLRMKWQLDMNSFEHQYWLSSSPY